MPGPLSNLKISKCQLCNVNHVLTVLELLQSKSRNLDDFLRARRRFVYRQFATPFGPQI